MENVLPLVAVIDIVNKIHIKYISDVKTVTAAEWTDLILAPWQS